MDDISEKPPENIDPYSALGLDPTASAAEIKTAYKKLALKHHPDKAPASAKSTANSTFQSIAFAYAILSNPKRRTLYDTTGSTSETLAQDDSDDFDWLSFFRVQLSQNFAEDLDKFSASYKGSEEEKETLLATYTKYRGKMNKIYEEVMLSNPLDDEQRFQAIITDAISAGQVESHDAFAKETQKSKDARMERARREAEEAEDEKKTNKAYQSIFGGDGKGGQRGMNDLATTIQGRQKEWQKEWQNGFMERMEERYGRGGKATDGKAKKRKQEEIEPDEAAFQRAQDQIFGGTAKKSRRPVNRTTKENGKSKGKGGRGKKAKTAVEEDVDDEDDEEIIDLQETSEGEEEAPEEEEVKPKPNPKPKTRAKAPKKAAAPATKARITRGRAKK